MDKSLDEVYQSPYEVNFSYDSIYNCLTNGKGDFELRGMGFNTGDIFVTAINYAPEEITECLQNIRNHIFDCSNS